MIVSFSSDYSVMYVQTNQEYKHLWRENPYLGEIITIAKKRFFYVVVRDGLDGWWVKNNGEIVNMKEAANAMQWIPPNL